VTFGNGLFATVANNGYSMVSPDGINWTEAVGNGTAWTSVAGGNGLFTATATDIGAAYSQDGLNWTPSAVVQPDTWTAVTYGQGSFSVTSAPFVLNGQNDYYAEFGYAIALSADGSILAVGAPYDYTNKGAVYVYTNGELSYTLQGQYERFGWVVALSADGSILAVSEQYRHPNPTVYVYTNGVLTYTVPCLNYNLYLGQNIALSADGSILAVGNPNQYPPDVYVYKNGSPLYNVTEPIGAVGFSVALSANGSILASSSLGNSATVYVYTNGVLTYTVSETVGYAVEFGWRVALSADGSVLAVSALSREVGGALGATYVYKNGVLSYSVQSGISDDYFGYAISLSADGSVLAVGAPRIQGYSGAVYVYTNGVLSETAYPPSTIDQQEFGTSVALYADGSNLAGGAPRANIGGQWGGQVYVFRPGSHYTSLFVAVANNGTTANVMYSSDGNVWSNATVGGYMNDAWLAVTYGNGTFVASANDGIFTRFMSSPNGQYWDIFLSTIPFSSNCITYGNGYFAALSSNTAVPRVAVNAELSLQAGYHDWKYSTVPSASYTGITYGPQGFVGVSPTQFTLEISLQFWFNPAQVSTSNKLNSSYWSGLAYGNGTFVAAGNGLIQGTRNQGNTWNSFQVSNLSCITYSQNLGTFVAIANTFTNGTYTSQDGLNWTQHTNLPVNVPSATTSITYGNGLFVSVLKGNSTVLYSRDGVYWNTTTNGTVSAQWGSVAYGNGTYVAVGQNSAMTSPDGVNWTQQTVPSDTWSSIVYGNGRFVAVANSGGSMYSSNGASWLPGDLPTDTWSSVTYGNGYFMAVSNNGTRPVAYSQDGINWSTQTTGFQTTNWGSIAFGQNTFMALNAQGASTMITQFGETF
jgi:hypothetical protein